MNIILKQIFKAVLPIVLPVLVKYFIERAEEKFSKAKSGKDKKAYVINKIEDILIANNIELNKQKIETLIDTKVAQIINR